MNLFQENKEAERTLKDRTFCLAGGQLHGGRTGVRRQLPGDILLSLRSRFCATWRPTAAWAKTSVSTRAPLVWSRTVDEFAVQFPRNKNIIAANKDYQNKRGSWTTAAAAAAGLVNIGRVLTVAAISAGRRAGSLAGWRAPAVMMFVTQRRTLQPSCIVEIALIIAPWCWLSALIRVVYQNLYSPTRDSMINKDT